MDLWPLLTEDLLDGGPSIERQLRPRVTAVATRSGSVKDLEKVVQDVCTRWAGGFAPLFVLSPGDDDIDDRNLKVLLRSNIDGIEVRKLLPDEIARRYSDRWAEAHHFCCGKWDIAK